MISCPNMVSQHSFLSRCLAGVGRCLAHFSGLFFMGWSKKGVVTTAGIVVVVSVEVTRVVDSVVGVAGVGVGLVGASVDGRVGEGAGGLVVGIGVVMGRGVEEGEVSVDSCGSVSKKGLGITYVVRNI